MTADDDSFPPLCLTRVSEHGCNAVRGAAKGVIYYPVDIRNLYVPHLRHPAFLGHDEEGAPKNYAEWRQAVVLEDKDAPFRPSTGNATTEEGGPASVGALMNRAVRNQALPSGWAPGDPLPDIATYERTRIGGADTQTWLDAKRRAFEDWMRKPQRGGWPCQRCLALGAPASSADEDAHKFVIGSIDTADAPWFRDGGAHQMATFWSIDPEWVCGVQNGPPGARLSEYVHEGGTLSHEGDFVPYAHRVGQMINHLRRWDVRAHGRIDFAAFFCHGWNDGIQLGLVADGGTGESRDARRLTRIFLELLAERATQELSISLYACKTATSDDTYGVNMGNHATLASSLRTELYELGIRNVRVDGHVDSADGIRAKRVRRFEGARQVGLWTMPPPRTEELQEEAEEAFVEDVARAASAVESRALLLAAQRLGAERSTRKIAQLFREARTRIGNGNYTRGRRVIDDCLALFDLYTEAHELREALWALRAPDTPDTPRERVNLSPRGERAFVQGRYSPAAAAFREAITARGGVAPPPNQAVETERTAAHEAALAEQERLQGQPREAQGYDEARWGKWERSLTTGYEYWNFRFPLMSSDEIVAWLDAIPDGKPCLADFRVSQRDANRRPDPVEPGTMLVHAHVWLWESSDAVGCTGKTRRRKLNAEGDFGSKLFSSDYVSQPPLPPPPPRPPRKRRVRVARARRRAPRTKKARRARMGGKL